MLGQRYKLFLSVSILFCFWLSRVSATTSYVKADIPKLAPGFYSIYFNNMDTQQLFLVLHDQKSALYLSEDDLESIHIDLTSYKGKTIAYKSTLYYRLDQFSHLSYAINREKMQLDINASPVALTKNNLKVAPETPLTPTISHGAYLNYYLNSSTASIGQSVDKNLLLQGNVFNAYGIGNTDFLAKDYNNQTELVRLNSNWIYTNPATMKSLTLGDSFSSLGSWNQSVGFVGIQYATDYATQPNFITSPMPSAQGVATLPSTVQVFVNNAQVSSQQINPGSFTLDNIPVVNGDGTMRIVTTNIIGEQKIEILPYSASSYLLKSGLSSYSYEAGFLRNNITTQSFGYSQAMVSGTYNRGITNRLTLQTHLEGTSQVQALGIGGIYLIPQIGRFNAAIAPSLNQNHQPGCLWLFGYTNNKIFGLNFGTNIQGTTSQFLDLGYLNTLQPPSLQLQVYLTGQWHGAIIGTSYIQQNNRRYTKNQFINMFSEGAGNTADSSPGTTGYVNEDSTGGPGVLGSTSFLSFSVSKPINQHFLITGIGLKSIIGTPSSTAMINFTYIFDTASTLTASTTQNNVSHQEQINLTKPLPTNTGIGYSLQTGSNQSHYFGSGQSYQGTLSAQNTMGQYAAGVSHNYGLNVYQAMASGSIGWMDQRVFLARPINNSFALVEVGAPGVMVSGNNNPFGRTGPTGNVVVTTMGAYIPNTIAINPSDLPFNATMSNPVQIINPYQGAGVVARFNVRTQIGGLVTLTNAEGKFIDIGATVWRAPKDNLDAPSMVGENGLVYLKGLHLGQNKMVVNTDIGKCTFNITMDQDHVSKANNPLPNLGTYTCLSITRGITE